MKRLIPALGLLVVLSWPAIAGEVSTPGVINPPPCVENCLPTTSSSTLGTITPDLILLVLGIVVP